MIKNLRPVCFIAALILLSFSNCQSTLAANPTAMEKLADAWRKLQTVFDKKKNAAKAAVKTFPKESMLGSVRLQGIVSSSHGGGDIAIFNGEYYRAGETVGDYKILSIRNASVEAENIKDGKRYTAWVVGTDFERNNSDSSPKSV